MIIMSSIIDPAAAEQMPTLWGLDALQLHVRFWAARGVQVVRQGGVCARVGAAVASAAHFTPDGTPLVVVRAGGRYVAFDPTGLNRAFFFGKLLFSNIPGDSKSAYYFSILVF